MLRPTDAAKRLKLHEFTIRRLCDDNDIGTRLGPEPRKGVRDNRPWILTEGDIERLREVAQPTAGRPRIEKPKPKPRKSRRKSLSEKG